MVSEQLYSGWSIYSTVSCTALNISLNNQIFLHLDTLINDIDLLLYNNHNITH